MSNLPDEVAGGVWRIPIDLEEATLTVNCFVLTDTDGNILLIDVGWRNLESVEILEDGLRALGHSLKDLRQVVVTHGHPDHAGLAPILQELTGCRVFLNRRDEHLLSMYRNPSRMAEWRAWMENHGMPTDELTNEMHAQFSAQGQWGQRGSVAQGEEQNTPRIEEHEMIHGVPLEAIWTPGHSPGHACFHLREAEVLFSGDHVLPRITPNVQLHPGSPDANPLGDYLDALKRVSSLPVGLVLPAHGEPFTDLVGRVQEIERHHRDRMHEVLGALDSGARSGWEVAQKVSWKQGSFDSLPYFHQRMAVGETLAHLRALSAEGLVKEEIRGEGAVSFSLA